MSNSAKAHVLASEAGYAEIRVEYDDAGAATVTFADPPPMTWANRLGAALPLVLGATWPYAVGAGLLSVLGSGLGLLPSTWGVGEVAKLYSGLVLLGVAAHLPPTWDTWLKRRLIPQTGVGRKNRLEVTAFQGTDFVLPDIYNQVLSYRATGEVADQLRMVWVRREHPSSAVARQATIRSSSYLKNGDVWNAHFRFAKRPRSGTLALEWI